MATARKPRIARTSRIERAGKEFHEALKELEERLAGVRKKMQQGDFANVVDSERERLSKARKAVSRSVHLGLGVESLTNTIEYQQELAAKDAREDARTRTAPDGNTNPG